MASSMWANSLAATPISGVHALLYQLWPTQCGQIPSLLPRFTNMFESTEVQCHYAVLYRSPSPMNESRAFGRVKQSTLKLHRTRRSFAAFGPIHTAHKLTSLTLRCDNAGSPGFVLRAPEGNMDILVRLGSVGTQAVVLYYNSRWMCSCMLYALHRGAQPGF